MRTQLLQSIHVHPIKSCRRVEVESARITRFGIEHDRTWQVVDTDGIPVTQRRHKTLASVQPVVAGQGLRLHAPEMESLDIKAPGVANTEARSMLGVPVPAHDAGPSAGIWFSRLLGVQCRLVAITDNSGWQAPAELELTNQPLAFVDAAPALVTTTSSLEWLVGRASEPFGMDRFRPNLVISNDEAWAEDRWQAFRVGQAALTTLIPWPRCSVPQIDQSPVSGLGIRRSKEPARVLSAHRRCSDIASLPQALRSHVEGRALFGIGCEIGPVGAVVRVGDPVVVTSRKEPLLAMPTTRLQVDQPDE